ncbi:MAG: MFS transporter [Clostridia bacterium]|nr:MFS transporter [Clostridia bacterium]
MTNKEKLERYMNRNIKLYPTYLAITWDILFIWTINTMYYTQVKGLTYSQAVSLESVLTLFSCVLCLFVVKFMKKVTPIKSLRIASTSALVFLLMQIFATSYIHLVIAQAFLGFSFAITMIKSNFILTHSLNAVNRDKEYQKVYGKGLSRYYVLEAICCIASSYIFDFNPDMVYWCASMIVCFAILYSFFFVEPNKYQEKNVEIDARKTSTKKQKGSMNKQILIFVIMLIVFAFILRATLGIASSNFRIFLQEMVNRDKLPLWAFGYIFAGMRILISFSTKYQFKYDLRYGVRCVLVFVSIALLTFLINSLIFLNLPMNMFTIFAIILFSYIQNSLRAPLNIFINNYIKNCVNESKRETIFALRGMMEYLGHSAGALLFSQLIGINNNYGTANLLFVSIIAVPLLIVTFIFVRMLIKVYANKNTIVKKEYVED